MTRYFFISVFFTGFFSSGFGQNLNNKVYQKIITADSVILVSHLTTYIPIVDDKTKERIGSYRLVEKNKVNYQIVKEHYQLDSKEIDSVAKIIITPNNDSIFQDIKCFMPHHGILIFKKGKCSYFDICFGCRHFITSKDIKLSDELDDKTWNALETFFRNRNLNYELIENNSDTENDN
jgi:hypothetical protein